MDNSITLFLFFSSLLTFIYATIISVRRNARLPPGPYPFPIIGNLLQLTDKPHRSLAALSKRYGPLMSLKLGSTTNIVVSSPDMAKELFQTHDRAISSRTVPESGGVVNHAKYSVVYLPVGDKWRTHRRISKEYLFSLQRLDASQPLRKEKVQNLFDHVNHCCTREKAVNIGEAAFTTSLNVLSSFIFSTDFAKYDSVSSQEFKDALWQFMEIVGKPNVADYFPILKPFDPQGLVREGNVYGKKIMAIFDRIIDQRLLTRSRSSSSSYGVVTLTNNDVLDLLLNLSLKDESDFSREDMKHLFLDLFIAGNHTTSGTLEWAMFELIRNPEKMESVRSEIIKLIGNNDNNIQEDDISQLPYLQAVIKETLRLHPPAPFLVPHQAIRDVEILGFVVPKKAQILFNVWAMGRDPKVWSNPETFLPERFLDVKIDYKGHDFELIPFGTGRRMCPGLNMAERMLHLMLASLIHKFHWKLEGNMRAPDLDIGEKFGLTLAKSVPLKAIPIRI